MDFPEATKVVFNRIQSFEPDRVSKIVGYLLLQDNAGREMVRMALGPDSSIHSLINRAKTDLGLPGPFVSGPISHHNRGPFRVDSLSPVSAGPRLFQQALAEPNPYWEPRTPPDSDRIEPAGFYCPEPALGLRVPQRSPGVPEFPVKVCHYFNKGFCKHGSNCKYFHAHPESFTQNYLVPNSLNEHLNDDNVISPRSLERLEIEITELLRSRRGFPVSIASLPMMYYEKYGRSLQAEGYLTESQRHGKTGYSLTKLLARLKHRIRLIDRPHGQHSVILVEDLPRYLEYYASERNGGIVSGSRQIYLTFPAESTFTEHDVFNYFNEFGPVQDVRIPCQQERMFGFVTFVYPETVRHILSKGNPHFICEARVLVKPYREKSRLVNRKFSEKMMHPMCRHFIGGELEFSPMPPRAYDKSRLRKQIMLETEQAFEIERRCFSEMNLASRTFLSHRPNHNYSMDELKLLELEDDAAEQEEFQSPDRFDYLLDVMNNPSTSEENELRNGSTDDHNDQDSQGLNLPESPFASAIGNEISTFT